MSEIRATTISNAAGTGPITMTGQYAAKAWVNLQGTGTATVLASANVSSITDLGTGNYAVTFTTAMTDANYATSSNSGWSGASNASTNFWSNQTTTETRLWSRNQYDNTANDPSMLTVTITR